MTHTPTIIIADRDPAGLQSCFDLLDLKFDCSFLKVATEKELHVKLAGNSGDILVLDLDFPNSGDRILFLQELRSQHPETVILPVLSSTEPSVITQLFDLNLHHYLTKPLDLQEAKVTLKKAWELHQIYNRTSPSPEPRNKVVNFHGMIGASPKMHRLFDLITRVADDDLATVLIRGESGTGKEMVAKAIHAESIRNNKNFVPVNCAAIPDDLLESELFGYIKGAFTGATANKQGRIQYANEGSLFLDEIGDMKSALQAKLLRVIQEKEFEPVGAFKSIPVNTRILAATHCDLEQQVSDGFFREDLYYRLSVIPIHIPPLRERREDIPPLIDYFLDKFSTQRNREPFTFSPRAMTAIMYYEWRGNVRELENLIQHMSVLYSGRVVDLDDLPDKFQNIEIPEEALQTPVFTQDELTEPSHTKNVQSEITAFATISWEQGTVDFNELINDFETRLIVQALRLTEGNKKEAARILNLKRTTLLEKIKKKDIDGLWEK